MATICSEIFVERRNPPGRNRAEIGNVVFDLIDGPSVLRIVNAWRNSGRREYISLVNPHSVMLCRRDDGMRRAVERGAVNLPDGVGIVVAADLLSYQHKGRLSGPELMLYLCDQGRAHGLSHYFYGGGDGVAERLASALGARYPGLRVGGWSRPPFGEIGEDQDADLTEEINRARPDIVWVGLGAPKQEKWMAAHLGKIDAPAMIGVGAAFDFHSGNRPWCPAALRRAGLEWAFRLLIEPRRLWRRNLDSPLFLASLSGAILTQKLFGARREFAGKTALDS
jgi:N-acetylglucosaminyldiphosphoundecaprenol N-acetyl-beta-D-mannosaminyltransferase